MGRRHARSGLMLMEIILSILFFFLCAAVCLQVFVHAKLTAQESRARDQAVLLAQTAAESWKAAAGDPERTAALLGADAPAGGALTVLYDGDFRTAAPGAAAAYELTLAPAAAGEGLLAAEIAVAPVSGEAPLFTLTVHLAEKGGAAE